MRDCTTRAFDGCSCPPGECQSESRNDEINRKIRLVQAKRNVDTAFMMLGTAFLVAVASLSFFYFAVPESQRLARANQENTQWR